MRILVFILAISSISFCASPAKATVFFQDSFESPLMSSGWTTGSCNPAGTPPSDGCNPTRSTDVAKVGTHSLKGDYSQSPCPGGVGVGSCGAWIDRSFPPSTNVYVRYWHYTAPGYQYDPYESKDYYLKGTNSTGGGSGGPNFFLWHQGGSREQIVGSQGALGSTGGLGGTPTQPCNSLLSACNHYPNRASVSLNDGTWYCIENHIDLGTPGVSNGVVETWINGVQTLGYYNQPFINVVGNAGNAYYNSDMKLNLIRIYTQLGHGFKYMDDFAVGDTRIGCSGSPSQSNDVTPPASPVGLTIH